jgi:galactose mutarotase-like enzyme
MYERFALTEHTSDQLVFTLKSSPEIYQSYPRDFVFQVIYTLRQNVLDITYRVENKDTRQMYFAVGGHPGFNVPLTAGKCFSDYQLRFGVPCAPRRVGFTEACFIDGTDAPFPLENDQCILLQHDIFDQDAIVLKNMATEVTLESDGGPSITVSYPGYPYLGIWHRPKTDAPYVCIEPWSSLPSTQDQIAVLEEQKDLLQLDPGGIYSSSWQIKINL